MFDFQHPDLAGITEGDSITIETTDIDQSDNIETVTVTTDDQTSKDSLPVNIFQNVSSELSCTVYREQVLNGMFDP